MKNEKEIEHIQARCTRFLTGHYRHRLTPVDAMKEMVEYASPDWQSDRYGCGELISKFEKRIAEILGKEAAVFMPSGTMCQQIALRIWSERKGSNNVAFHPKCHLEIHEQKGYQRLHSLHGVLVGHPERMMTIDDLKRVHEPIAALLLELPQREIGGQLPPWDELISITEWARERDIALHMDGARLWEIRPYYRRNYSEIAALFDSVYVSFYKGLGGLAGALLAGQKHLIDEARIWQRRHGGNLIRLYPYVISAQIGLDKHLSCMDDYYAYALKIAAVLGKLPQIEVTPNPPHSNMMHVYLRGDAERLVDAALAIAEEKRVSLFSSLSASAMTNYHKLELSVGEATLDLSVEEIAGLFMELFERA